MTRQNRPGLDAVHYRLGGHAEFKRELLRGLADAARPALQGLTTRDDGDFIVALLDAWAATADVFTFYQERIASESWLRTAGESLSVAELARLVGYQPGPGVAATAALAFTLDDAPAASAAVRIEPGFRVQSIPGPGGHPQVYETLAGADLRPAWNLLRAAQAAPGRPRRNSLRVAGDGGGVRPGDLLLIFDLERPDLVQQVLVDRVEPDGEATRVSWPGLGGPLGGRLACLRARRSVAVAVARSGPGYDLTAAAPAPAFAGEHPLVCLVAGHLAAPYRVADGAILDVPFTQLAVRHHDLQRTPGLLDRTPAATLHYDLAELPLAADPDPRADDALHLHGQAARLQPGDALLVHAAANRGHWRLYHVAAVAPGERQTTVVTPARVAPHYHLPIAGPLVVRALRQRAALFGHNAPDPRLFGAPTGPLADLVSGGAWVGYKSPADALDLDAVHPRVVPGDPVVVSDGFTDVACHEVTAAMPTARADYGLQARVSRLSLRDARDLDRLDLRTTEVLAVPETLALADDPLPPAVDGDSLLLAGRHDLPPGRPVLLVGDLADGTGPGGQVVTVSACAPDGEHTLLEFTPPLARPLARAGLVVRGNVARASHGETVEEVLGSGDARRVYQRFTLRQGPLTHLRAPTASGRVAALAVRVGGLLWREVPHLLDAGPADHVYTLRTDDAGVTTVQFGDGVHGARLPSGNGNVRATYRRGAGRVGEVARGTLRVPLTRPQGLRDVDNPLPADGAADRETLAEARANVPRAVLTLGRIVSLRDYQDFARAFPGIAKAGASQRWDGHERRVVVHVAGHDGAVVAPGSDLHTHLRAALRALSDPHVPVELATPRFIRFRVAGRVQALPDHDPAAVLAGVRAALRAAFGFAARDFAQPVHRSEVVAAAQAAPGVAAVDLDALHVGAPAALRDYLPARAADGAGDPVELLTLDETSLADLEVFA